jgi:hypothetical protein
MVASLGKRSLECDLDGRRQPEQPTHGKSNRPPLHMRRHPRRSAVGPLERQADDRAVRVLDEREAPAEPAPAVDAHERKLHADERMDGESNGDPVRMRFRTCRSLRLVSGRGWPIWP